MVQPTDKRLVTEAALATHSDAEIAARDVAITRAPGPLGEDYLEAGVLPNTERRFKTMKAATDWIAEETATSPVT